MFRKLLILTLVCCSFGAIAKAQEVTIKLKSIAAVKTVEKGGDEIYFSITQYSNKKTPEIFRVPIFPMHFLTKELPQIKDVDLWQGKIQDDESILLIFSLIEQDLPPWNVDEHIGSAKAKLFNKGGKITVVWGQPDFTDQPKVQQPDPKLPKFIMYGEKSEYVIEFKMVQE